MKKTLLIICLLLILCSCSKKDNNKLNSETNNTTITDNNIGYTENTKTWLEDISNKKVITIFCLTTSKKCTELNSNINQIKNTKVYFLYLDEITDEEKNVYKNKYDLKDYTGYTPYLILSDKNKLLKTDTDLYKIDDINKFINE